MPSTPSHPATKERVLNERDPDILRIVYKRRAEGGRHDADDGEGTLVERNRGSKDLRVCSEGAAPQIFAEDDDRWRALLAIVRIKNAALKRLHIEKLEVLRRDDTGVHDGGAPPVSVSW